MYVTTLIVPNLITLTEKSLLYTPQFHQLTDSPHQQVLVCNGCHECDDHSDEYNCTLSRDESHDQMSEEDEKQSGEGLRCPSDTGR